LASPDLFSRAADWGRWAVWTALSINSKGDQMQSQITLRQTSINDLAILLEWRNDPLTRNASHNSDEVTQGEHEQWLKATLNNPDRQLYIAEENGESVGTVRVDFSNGVYELSWTVSPKARGRGVGKRMVALLANKIKDPIRAEIKVGNTASVRIAEHIGMSFQCEKDDVMYYRRPRIEG
jgi:RimJ/RimL family protein N-acetyltransferase